MHPMKKVITAGLVAAALGVAPAAVTAQETSGTAQTQSGTEDATAGTSGDTQTGSQTGTQAGTQQQSSQMGQQQGSGGADQEAVRQHLASARQSLAELTQLPAAGKLDGPQREQVSQFISHFNEFATATTDWREKYEKVDQSLDQILGTADEAPSASAATPSPSADASPSSTGGDAAAGAGGAASGFDPSIIAKLRETREHLDAFELATGDPGFIADRIERILENAQTGEQGDATVGTAGATTTGDRVQGAGASATGMVTLSQSQVEDIRRHLERLRRR